MPFFIDGIYQDHYPTLLYLDNNNYLKEKNGNKLKNYIKEEIKQSKICSRCHWYFVFKADEKSIKKDIALCTFGLILYNSIFEIYFYILLLVILHSRMAL